MNQSVKAGLISGLIAAACMYIKVRIEMPMGLLAVVHFTGLFAYIGGIYLAVKRTRDMEMGGLMGFRQGLKPGTIASLISSLLQAVAFYYTLLSVDYLHAKHPITGRLLTETPTLLQTISSQNMFDSTKYWLITNILLGFMVTIAAALLLRKKQTIQNN